MERKWTVQSTIITNANVQSNDRLLWPMGHGRLLLLEPPSTIVPICTLWFSWPSFFSPAFSFSPQRSLFTTYKWNRPIWTPKIDKIIVENVYFLQWFVKTWWWFISASFLIFFQHVFAFVWATGFPNFIPRRYQFDSKMTSLPLLNARR